MRRTFLFMVTLFIASTSLEALSEPSNTAQSSRLAYYISVVKKRFQGKPLTRKEAQTLSSLKKLTVISLAVAGTLGATGLYRLCMGHPTSNGDAAVEEESISAKAMPDTAAEGEEETDWDDDPEHVYEPSADEKQQLQEKLAPKLASLDDNDGFDDLENLPFEPQEVPDELAAALKQRRRRVSHATANAQRRERRRARIAEKTFKPEDPSEDQ